jgi:hypothetical protein
MVCNDLRIGTGGALTEALNKDTKASRYRKYSNGAVTICTAGATTLLDRACALSRENKRCSNALSVTEKPGQ